MWRSAISAAIVITLALVVITGEAGAVIERIYSLPFQGQYTIGCGFGCCTGHEGTDYTLDEHIAFVIEALKPVARELRIAGNAS